MAKLTQKTVVEELFTSREVKNVFELELTKEELTFLSVVLWNVGGMTNESYRKYQKPISATIDPLVDQYLRFEMDAKVCCESIYFKDLNKDENYP